MSVPQRGSRSGHASRRRAVFGRRKAKSLKPTTGRDLRPAAAAPAARSDEAAAGRSWRTVCRPEQKASASRSVLAAASIWRSEAARFPRYRLLRCRTLRQRRGQAAGGNRASTACEHPHSTTTTAKACSTGCRQPRSSRVDLLYPDPWPKKRHWKRRFVNADNLDRIARVLKPGGEFRFVSDIDTYVELDAAPLPGASGSFEWTARARRRLARALGRLAAHPLRGQGGPRGPHAGLSDFQAHLTCPPRLHFACLATI